jgi:NADH-quinone oxidoreductase subunit N
VHYRLDLCLPELFQLAVMALLFIQAISRRQATGDTVLSSARWVPIAAAAGVVVALLSLNFDGLLFWGAYQVDALSQFFKLAVAVGFFIVSLNAVRPPQVQAGKLADYFLFLATSAWGLMLLASSVELITVYVALEISSYSLYAIIPLRATDRRAAEAGIKYIMFGAVATAVSLYGFSYILAAQHTSYISELATMDWSWAGSPMAVTGLTLFLCGMFFKLALFPFHFWAPDVYQGTGNETAAFVATLPKLGAVVVLVRLAALLKPGLEITNILAVFGAVSMTFGNLAALAQRDLKRLLGYSSIAHAGYVMLGLVAGTAAGLAAASFYSLIYLLMNLTCFWVICRVAEDGRNLTFDDLNGLYKRAPELAFVLAVSAFALVGLPPTAGFTGKLFLLSAAWDHGYDWLVIVAVLNTAIAIYYYLSMVRHAYTKESEAAAPRLTPSTSNLVWGGLLAAVLLLLGALPGPVFELAMEAGARLIP